MQFSRPHWSFSRSFLGLLVAAILLPAACTQQVRSAPDRTQQVKGDDPKHEPPTLADTGFKLSGPYQHENLQVFLVHGKKDESDREILTLGEAMANKQVVVHETQNVQELAIENRGDKDVYIQAGDIVRGGQQDRVLAVDMILEPKSGKHPIASFCVEQGRWSKRGGEDVFAFSSSSNQVSSNELKRAVKVSKKQQEVWDNVTAYRRSVSQGTAQTAPRPREAQAEEGQAGGLQLVNVTTGSTSSLELMLSDPAIKKLATDYDAKLRNLLKEHPDAIGLAYAVNGKMTTAEIYNSSRLFGKLWGKLLDSAVMEAVAKKPAKKPEQKDNAENKQPQKVLAVADAEAFLAEQRSAKLEKRWVNDRVQMYCWSNKGNDYFETSDRKSKGGWIHRQFLAK